MKRYCQWCTGRVPDLPGISGDYCSGSCRFLAEWSEEDVPFALPISQLCAECGRLIVNDGIQLAVKNQGRLMCAWHVIDPAVLAETRARVLQERTARFDQIRADKLQALLAEEAQQQALAIQSHVEEVFAAA